MTNTGDCDGEHDDEDDEDDEQTRSLPYRPHAQGVRREEVRPNVATRARLRQRLAKGKLWKTRETGVEKKR